MADFNSIYKKLFNAITILQQAQVDTEEMYINHEPAPIKLITPEDGGDDA